MGKKKAYKKSPAVKMLEALAMSDARQKFSEIPEEWLAPRKYRDDSANALTKCVIDFIKLAGGQAERISNTGRLIGRQITFTDVVGRQRTIGEQRWIKGSGTNGTADISATIVGRSVKIEVKHGKDRQSEAQKKYQTEVVQAGGVYIIVRSFQEFYDWYLEFIHGVSEDCH